ncbi:MAG: amino acid transporter [Ponticaulis sp.]|nr:amino acid transporter [Ponticaulis sp.]
MELKRSLGFVSLTLYGVGVTLGAGIYVLIGETAATAGSLAPLSFLIALIAALLSGLSYAELSGRYPASAGEAVYVQEAFGKPWLSQVVGAAVTFTGLFSSATVLQGFSGYAIALLPVPAWILILVAAAVLTGLALWGVKESVWAAAAVTVFEAGGLIVIIVLAAPKAIEDPVAFMPVSNPALGVMAGAAIAFFAFIGFEDIVNMSEETKEPSRNVPRAILATMIITGVIYMAIAWVAVAAVLPGDLAEASDPMAEILRQTGHPGDEAISIIAIVAILNGALINMLMASRVLYGMAKKGLAPAVLATVNSARKTPHVATLLVTAFVLTLALLVPLSGLARMTSFLTLCVFLLINLSLIILRRKHEALFDVPIFKAPLWTPYLGIVTAGLLAISALAG